MKKLFMIAAVVILFSGLISGVRVAPAPAAEKPVELSVSHMYPSGSFEDKHINRWAKKVEEDSKGRLKFRIFPGGVLFNAFETYAGVVKGVADIGASYRYDRKGAELTGMVSECFAGVPDAAIGTRILDDIRKKFPEWDKEWEAVKVLWAASDGPAYIATKPRPVKTLEDLKGLQLRVPVREAAEGLKALGGTPVGMPLADFVIGLEKGTVDGGTVQKRAIQSYKLAPAAKFCTEMSLYSPSNWFMAMNWNKWKALPPDLQKVIDDSREWGKRDCVATFDDGDKAGIEWAKGQGMEFIPLKPEEKKRWLAILKDAYGKLAAGLDARGYPATKTLVFAQERVAEYVK
jgi:TRAP-type C4-dicarboxylate transport system substrate-binding protein